jgi:deoxyribodipyrimidine photo-lyase
MSQAISLFWFRRDLRLEDNAGLFHALKGPNPVLPIFIFDREILDDLSDPKDARVEFIYQAVSDLKKRLEEMGSTLLVYYGKPLEIWSELLQTLNLAAVFTNRDFEPYAIERDNAVQQLLSAKNIPFHTYKDHVIFEKDEVLKNDGTPYTIFTPYSKRWLEKLQTQWRSILGEDGEPQQVSFYLTSYPTEKYFSNFAPVHRPPSTPNRPPSLVPRPPSTVHPLPSPVHLSTLGFFPSGIQFPPTSVARSIIRNYDKTRDIPSLPGTSRLGVHFRFGTISIREKARNAQRLNTTYLNELIWRDFYSQIMGNFPHVVNGPFRPQYDLIEWRDSPEDLDKWKRGLTGYPIVDAGMRELNATGYMHNRVRMIVASFFSKHLLLNWRLGEAYFAEKLLDFDLASNSGGWQWAAGCGTDAAPYFRIFNPTEQTKKFDPEYKYIRKWVPEFGTPKYPMPIVEHKFARERCLKTYKAALQ